MGLMKELNELNAIYQAKVYADVDEAMVVTNADKKGNTPAYQNYKKGMKGKDGKPMYKAADHMKEGKVNAGLQAYLDKKKGKKSDDNGNGKKNGSHGNGNGNGDNGNGNGGKGNGGNGKGGKPDFLDLDKDGNKKESMKSAAKSAKKEETDYNYVNSYLSELSKKTMGSYIAKGAKDLANRRFDQGDSEKRKYDPDESDEKEDKKLDKREQGIARAAKKMSEGMYGYNKGGMVKKSKAKPTVTINKPDKLVSMKVSKESFDKLIESGIFSDIELQNFLFDTFEEEYIEENRQVAMEPEKHKDPDESDKPYRQRSKAARMRDPQRGINSPAFKKFMADRGM